jgi:hypothetical protein
LVYTDLTFDASVSGALRRRVVSPKKDESTVGNERKVRKLTEKFERGSDDAKDEEDTTDSMDVTEPPSSEPASKSEPDEKPAVLEKVPKEIEPVATKTKYVGTMYFGDHGTIIGACFL